MALPPRGLERQHSAPPFHWSLSRWLLLVRRPGVVGGLPFLVGGLPAVSGRVAVEVVAEDLACPLPGVVAGHRPVLLEAVAEQHFGLVEGEPVCSRSEEHTSELQSR